MLLAIDARPLTPRPTGVAQFLLATPNKVDFAPDWAFAGNGYFMFTLGPNVYRAPLP